MKVYLAFVLTLGISVSIIAGSLIFLLWAATKFDPSGFEYKIAKIATIWVDCLIALGNSYFAMNTLAQEIMQHKMATTAFILIAISIVTTISLRIRHCLPIACAGCAFPFLMYGIWFDPSDYYASPFWFMFGWSIVSIIYVGFVALEISERRKKASSSPEQPNVVHRRVIKLNHTESSETVAKKPTAFDALADIIEQGVNALGIE